MKYTIFSVDNSRQHYIDKMKFNLLGWDQIDTYCVDGRIPEELMRAREQHPYDINFEAKVGHLGIWFTV